MVLPYLKNAFLATAAMAIAVIVLQKLGAHVLINVAAAIAVYFGLLLVLKEPLLKEIGTILRPAVSDARETDESVA